MIKCQKDKFQLHPDIHYFNNASKGPLLKSSEKAAVNALVMQRNPSDFPVNFYFSKTDLVKTLFSKLINCNSNSIAIVPSVSYGFASVLKNTKAKYKGHVITIRDEFPSGYLAVKKWCTENDNELKIIAPNGDQDIGLSWNENLISSINQDTSFVLMCSVHWMNGLNFDIEAIGKKCKEVGAMFYLDGTQSVGAIPIDVEKCKVDALICSSYKWLFGPYSLGLAYMSPVFNNGIPIEESWMNRTNAHDFTRLTDYEESYFDGASRYCVGETSNFILMDMLADSLTQLIQWTPFGIQEYCKELIRPLKDYMNSNDLSTLSEPYFSNHLFSIKMNENLNINLLKQKLKENNIIVSQRGSGIRLSVNVFNNEEDINALLNCLNEFG